MIKIITDSTIYVSFSEANELGIRIVPITYTINDYPCFETYTDQNGNFEELLRSNGKFATLQPNSAAFLKAFEEETARGNEVLCITISSRLSGIYNAACLAAEQLENKNVSVFDSRLTAGGLYLLVQEAKKQIDQGQGILDILKKMTEIREKIILAFSVDDMAPLRNSGRIGFVRMGVGTVLNTKPILLCKDGVIVSDSLAHGNHDMIKKLAKKIPASTSEVVLNYISDHLLAGDLRHIIQEKFPNTKIRLCKMGPVLGIHLGLKVLAVSFIAP